MTEAIWRWSATRVAAAIRGREISAREAVEASLARMPRSIGKLNAVTVDLSDAGARRRGSRRSRSRRGGRAARAAARRSGDDQGKRRPGRMRDDQRRRRLSRPDRASRLPGRRQSRRSAGAIIIGRTNTPAFSFRLDTVNDLRGRTYNPWSKHAYAGRLAGGAASSVAAGHHAAGARQRHRRLDALSRVRLRHRRHPAFVRSRALRTIRRSKAERSLSAQLMSVQGPLARSVADLRLGFAAMAARDARDPWWVPAPLDGPAPPTADPRRRRDRRRRSRRRRRFIRTSPQRSQQAARWLADAGYEIVDERTPGFTARLRAVVRDADPGVPRLHAADYRERRRRRHPDRDAVHAGERAVARRAAVYEGAGRAHATGARLDGVPRSRAAGARAGLVGCRSTSRASTSKARRAPRRCGANARR